MPTDPTSAASSSILPKGSPKRKRENPPLSSPVKASPLRLFTNSLSLAQTPTKASQPDDLSQSPRSRVASRFSDMEITPVSLNNSTTTMGATIAGPRKLDFKADHSPISHSDRPTIGRKKQRTSLQSAKEIPETPGAREGVKSGVHSLATVDPHERRGVPLWEESPTIKRKEVDHVFGGGAVPAENGDAAEVGNKGPPVWSKTPPIPPGKVAWIDSKPPHPHLTKAKDLVGVLHDEKIEDDAHSSEPETEPGSLHWDDSEITGHDPSDPEDDGEGINGIGFKPTAAMARDRSERRRKQMEQYKSREDKEARAARAKRSEARRRAVSGEERRAEEERGRRRVRFAEKERAMDVL